MKNPREDQVGLRVQKPLRSNALFCVFSICLMVIATLGHIRAAEIHNLWPGTPPGDENVELPPEGDTTGEDGRLVAGKRVMRLGNVSTPQLHVYQPKEAIRTGAAVVVAPGGGHYILAWDLEGTEVAEWLNSIGVTAIVLKYRVPSRDHESERRWLWAVQDAQRAMSIVRSRANDWKIDSQRIGIMGFSAGGQTAALTALVGERLYERVDATDDVDYLPNFVAPIYTGGLVPREGTELYPNVNVGEGVPPFFMVHANDDRASPLNSAQLYVELKKQGASAELHIFESGGHGYGLRPTDQPVTRWPKLMEVWMNQIGVLGE